ncbi:MAG: FkbM family methyltransferase [Sedimenticola sp.]|nr:FkbM family methyltransferase [Sedimenticola sp.]
MWNYFKKLAKLMTKKTFTMLPSGVREILFNAYIEMNGTSHIFQLLANLNNVARVVIRGNYGDITGSPNDQAILLKYAQNGKWADRTNEIISEFFKRNNTEGTYIDIGANIGLTTIPVSIMHNVVCYCFEPDPTNFSYLQENIKNNCTEDNVKAFNLAIYNEEVELSFEKSPINFGDYRIRLGEDISSFGENLWETIIVPAMPLKNIITDIKKPLVVKIDTQGAEPYVILGGGNILSNADLVIFEFSPYMMKRMGSDPEIVLNFVNSFPYVAIANGENSPVQSYLSGKEAVLILREFFDNSIKQANSNYCDVICSLSECK